MSSGRHCAQPADMQEDAMDDSSASGCSDARLTRRAALTGLASIGISTVFVGRLRAQSIDLIVETTHGKVRGISRDGVNIFRGIPYAASTAGNNRFLPPQSLHPWPGIRDAIKYGDAA